MKVRVALVLLAVVFVGLTWMPGYSKSKIKFKDYKVSAHGVTVELSVPVHDKVTVSKKKGFIFYSVKTLVKDDPNMGISICGEMSVTIWRLTKEFDVFLKEQRKITMQSYRKLKKEIKHPGQSIWLIDEHSGGGVSVVQFIHMGGAVIRIIASRHKSAEIPKRSTKDTIAFLSKTLENIKISVNTEAIRKYMK